MVNRYTPRLTSKHEFSELTVALFEQADLMLDYPYQVLVTSANAEPKLTSFSTQIEALQMYNTVVHDYIADKYSD